MQFYTNEVYVLIQRHMQNELVQLMTQYPVVTVMGPRQSGKTTLVQSLYPNKPYVNLEEPDARDFSIADPRRFFAQYPDGVILDEIQHAPILISYIQSIVDQTKKPGMFILTGSHQLQLHEAINQSLAGRTALLELLPLTIAELQQHHINMTTDEYLYHGFFPAIYQHSLNPTIVHRNYCRTTIESDVRQLINIKNLIDFRRFMQLAASRVGSILNIEGLANDVGLSHNTIKNWFSILDASYISYQLQPYYENFGKRVIKSSKLYFNDVGLVCYLLDIDSTQQVTHDRLRGSLFENMVLLELIKIKMNQGKEPRLYYYRDSHGHEIDVIVKHHRQLIPVEIKSSETFNNALLKNIKKYQTLVGDRARTGFLIYAGEQEQQIDNIHVLNYRHTGKIYQIIEE
jgi:uncharacterized protein